MTGLKEIRAVFMGTPEFAVPALRALAASCRVVAVVTRPDRPGGRGKKTAAPAVKREALRLGLPVLQPVRLKDPEFLRQLQELDPVFLVTAAYGRILPEEILAVPRVAALNIHASLLPRWRGAAPIHRAVINGDTKSGVTIIYMDAGMDTGDIVLQEAVTIGFYDTAGDLHDRLSGLGARLIVTALNVILDGSAPRQKQDDALATYAPPLRPEEEIIDWQAPALSIHNLVRGMNPSPGAYTLYQGERFKIRAGRPMNGYGPVCGMVLSTGERGILVAAGDGSYLITEIQPPGRRSMPAADFLRGHRLKVGTILG